MDLVSLDVGLKHLAYICMVLVQHQFIWTIQTVKEIVLLDITQFDCDRGTCILHHDKCVTDYLRHVFQSKAEFIDADTILVEQQPPQGLIVVQEIIRNEFRHKVELVSPRSVHAYFGISKRFKGVHAYERRKEWSTKFAVLTLKRGWGITLDAYERKHDIADAWCQAWFYIQRLNRTSIKGRSKYFIGSNPAIPMMQQVMHEILEDEDASASQASCSTVTTTADVT
jgi:hypothetical protein